MSGFTWEIPDHVIEEHFKAAKERLADENPSITFSWSVPVVGEITPNVARTLSCKFRACHLGYGESKIAALYTFWTAKLKPGFGLEKAPLYVNEYLALKLGFSIIYERLNLRISLSDGEFLNVCDTLRYHTSSPHMLMNLYDAWIDRERLRDCLRQHGINTKNCKKKA